MPSITFINFDNEKLEIDLSKTDNSTAFKKGCDHLDKPLNKKLFNEFIKRTEKWTKNYQNYLILTMEIY